MTTTAAKILDASAARIELEVAIEAPIGEVWKTIVEHPDAWWVSELRCVPGASKMVFDPVSMDQVDVGIVEVDPVTGAQAIEAFDDDFRVLALTLDPATGDFITASTNSGFDSFTISRVSGNFRMILATDDLLDTPRGVVIDNDAGVIYVADSNEVLSFPIAGGPQTSVHSASIFGSGGMVMDSDGSLLVTVGNSFVGRVFRVDPSDGSAVQLANAGLLLNPRGIAVHRVPEPGFLSGLVASTLLLTGLVIRRIKCSSDHALPGRDFDALGSPDGTSLRGLFARL